MANSDEFNQVFRYTPTDKLEQLISSTQKFLDEISKDIEDVRKKSTKQEYDKFMLNFQAITEILSKAECELFERKNKGK